MTVQAGCYYYWSCSKKRCIHPVSRVWTGGKLNISAEKIISHCLSPVVALTRSLLAAAPSGKKAPPNLLNNIWKCLLKKGEEMQVLHIRKNSRKNNNKQQIHSRSSYRVQSTLNISECTDYVKKRRANLHVAYFHVSHMEWCQRRLGMTSSLKFMLFIFKKIHTCCKWNCKALTNIYITSRGSFYSLITTPACTFSQCFCKWGSIRYW